MPQTVVWSTEPDRFINIGGSRDTGRTNEHTDEPWRDEPHTAKDIKVQTDSRHNTGANPAADSEEEAAPCEPDMEPDPASSLPLPEHRPHVCLNVNCAKGHGAARGRDRRPHR